MFAQYASFRTKVDAPALSVLTGGTTTIAHNYYYHLQLENRSGKNLLSDSFQINVPAGNKLVWTIPLSAIETGDEIFYYVLSASTTGNDTDAVILAKIQSRDADQTNIRYPIFSFYVLQIILSEVY